MKLLFSSSYFTTIFHTAHTSCLYPLNWSQFFGFFFRFVSNTFLSHLLLKSIRFEQFSCFKRKKHSVAGLTSSDLEDEIIEKNTLKSNFHVWDCVKESVAWEAESGAGRGAEMGKKKLLMVITSVSDKLWCSNFLSWKHNLNVLTHFLLIIHFFGSFFSNFYFFFGVKWKSVLKAVEFHFKWSQVWFLSLTPDAYPNNFRMERGVRYNRIISETMTIRMLCWHAADAGRKVYATASLPNSCWVAGWWCDRPDLLKIMLPPC